MSKSEIGPTQRMLNTWAIVLIMWSFYRTTFVTTLPPWFDEFIAKPAVFLLPMYWFVVKSEKKLFLDGIGFSQKNIQKDALFGLGVGSLFIIIAIATRIMKGASFPHFAVSFSSIIWGASTIMASSMEQILSTGFVFSRLLEESDKNIVKPLLVSAVLFFFLHIPVLFGGDTISLPLLIQMMILNTILSFITSIVFLMRRNIISPILVHALYLLSLPLLI